MDVAVPNQCSGVEHRAPLTPAAVQKLRALGAAVRVEKGAGAGAHYTDADYEKGNAVIVAADQALSELWAAADVMLTLHPPTVEQATALRRGSVLVGMLAPLANGPVIKALAQGGITAFSMEFIPRISRAQAMDVLSSQASIGGYVAVVRAAVASPKMYPMMITAAGTIAPAKVFVIGAGVAGLQAIATAKRLGAQVEAYDVRPVVKEQVQSLGGRFVELPTTKQDAQTAGGYAKEQTEDERRQQAALMAKHVIGADVVITTAAVFGKAPPLLIPADVAQQMASGAVLVDMAADPAAGRGNCEITRPGEIFTTDAGAIIDGTLNLPAHASVHASQMYANNMLAFLKEIIHRNGEAAALKLNLEDEIQKGALITHNGEIVNQMVKEKLA